MNPCIHQYFSVVTDDGLKLYRSSRSGGYVKAYKCET